MPESTQFIYIPKELKPLTPEIASRPSAQEIRDHVREIIQKCNEKLNLYDPPTVVEVPLLERRYHLSVVNFVQELYQELKWEVCCDYVSQVDRYVLSFRYHGTWRERFANPIETIGVNTQEWGG